MYQRRQKNVQKKLREKRLAWASAVTSWPPHKGPGGKGDQSASKQQVVAMAKKADKKAGMASPARSSKPLGEQMDFGNAPGKGGKKKKSKKKKPLTGSAQVNHAFVRFVDETCGDGDGSMNQRELQDAFRMLHRKLNKTALAQRQNGVQALTRLVDSIALMYKGQTTKLSKAVSMFFTAIDSSNAGAGNGNIDKNELRNGLKILAKKGCSNLDKEGIEEDLLHIMRYIDEDSSDSVEAHELSLALKKARRHALEGDEDMKQLQNFGG